MWFLLFLLSYEPNNSTTWEFSPGKCAVFFAFRVFLSPSPCSACSVHLELQEHGLVENDWEPFKLSPFKYLHYRYSIFNYWDYGLYLSIYIIGCYKPGWPLKSIVLRCFETVHILGQLHSCSMDQSRLERYLSWTSSARALPSARAAHGSLAQRYSAGCHTTIYDHIWIYYTCCSFTHQFRVVGMSDKHNKVWILCARFPCRRKAKVQSIFSDKLVFCSSRRAFVRLQLVARINHFKT